MTKKLIKFEEPLYLDPVATFHYNLRDNGKDEFNKKQIVILTNAFDEAIEALYNQINRKFPVYEKE